MKITGIRTEYLKDPIGIDIVCPRIRWTLEGVEKQTAYEIRYRVLKGGKAAAGSKPTAGEQEQTAGEKRQTVCEQGAALSSGIIESASMYYDFTEPFESRDVVRFTVRALCDGHWLESGEHSFELGLLAPSDWTAQWITGDYRADKKTRYPVDCFRKVFELPAGDSSDAQKSAQTDAQKETQADAQKETQADAQAPVRARLYITACGLYEASLNGQRVGEFVLAPGSTDYRKRLQYQTYDVTDLVRAGKNTMELLLADGWYRGSIGAKGFTQVFGKTTAVLAQLEVTAADGSVTVIGTDESFAWSNDGELRFADLKDGEVVDKNLTPTYSGHARAVKKGEILPTAKQVPLTASNNSHIREQERFAPAKTFLSPSGKRIYEFSQNLAGIVSFRVSASKGEEVRIRMGEMLGADGELTLKNIQCVRKGKATPLQEIRLICREGVNEYHGRFMIAGFRYLEVEDGRELEALTQIALYTDLEETSDFRCDNELINILVRNTLWSLKSNSADVPTDCPTRERMGWTGDSQVFFNSAAYLTDYAAFSRKHVADIFDRQDKNGRLPQIAPYNAEDWFMDVMNGSVGWADAGILIPYRFYERYGDDRLLRKYYDDMVRYAKFMIGRCGPARGIYSVYAKPLKLSKENRRYGVNTGQSYGEWAEPADVKSFVWTDFCTPNPEESMAYTSSMLSLMIRISEQLGRTENIALFREYSEGVKRAYQELVTKERHSLDTDRQAKLVRPLYMDLLTEEQTEFAKARLLRALENYGYRLGTGFLSTPFILDVLASYDVEACYRLLENEEKPGWLYMAKHSTGTIWEDWAGPEDSQAGIASLNHYSKGAVVEWLISGMAGICVNGENRFRIAPVAGGHVREAAASYRSVYGTVSCSWKRSESDGRALTVNITVPSNTTAEFAYGGTSRTFGPGEHTFTV